MTIFELDHFNDVTIIADIQNHLSPIFNNLSSTITISKTQIEYVTVTVDVANRIKAQFTASCDPESPEDEDIQKLNDYIACANSLL